MPAVRLRNLLCGFGHEPCAGDVARTRASVRRGTGEFGFGFDALGDDPIGCFAVQHALAALSPFGDIPPGDRLRRSDRCFADGS